MIRFIEGSIDVKSENGIVIKNNGMGYFIHVPETSSFHRKEYGDIVKVLTVMIVREDDISLFGFESSEEIDLFNRLITVNGVGAKAAMSIFSAMSYLDIKKAIYMEDVSSLTRANGIGKKTAQKIVIDLKDKIGDVSTDLSDVIDKPNDFISSSFKRKVRDDVVSALEELGYSKNEAIVAVDRVNGEDLSLEEYIKLVLKQGI